MSHFGLFHWIMIQIFIAHTASEAVVRGVIGQPVRLPCFYQVMRHKDISDMCWGRGPCPNSKCNNKILHTTGNRVTFRKSQRYDLRGYISYGDVSLTIGKVKAEDAGTYCCRVEIPGWFNDIKQNMRLEVVRAPPVMTTTTRKAPVSPKRFRKTTFTPQTTSGHQATAETAVLLTTTVPKATTATTDHQATAETAVLLTTTIRPATTTITESPAVMMLETIAPPVFPVTTNDVFPETMLTTSALLDFSTDFQASDMRTEDDDVFCTTESFPLPGDTEVTTEFPSTLPTAEGTKSAHTSLTIEDVPTADVAADSALQCSIQVLGHDGKHQAITTTVSHSFKRKGTATTLPAPTTLWTLKRTLAPSGISTSSDDKAEKHDDDGDKFPSYAILIACLIAASILFTLMLLLFWKRKHTKKFIIKSLRPAEDLEKVFSGTEGENSIFSL